MSYTPHCGTRPYSVIPNSHLRQTYAAWYVTYRNPNHLNLFIVVFTSYLTTAHGIDMPPNQYWYCRIGLYIVMSCTMCSNHLVVSMTFQRFYSIVRPHKAASFNTVKRAKIFIGTIVIFSFLYCSPHLFVTYFLGRYCIPYAKILDKMSGQFYYWLTFVLNFIIPFVSLVIMNTVIIKTLYRRSKSNLTETIKIRKEDQSDESGQGQTSQMKSAERQIYTMLLLVTFSFLILSTPSYAMMLYSNFVDHFQCPYHFAAYILFVQVGDKAASN